MRKSLVVAGLIAAAAFGLAACGGSEPATYGDLTASQQAEVDRACHADSTYPAEHPAEFGHCVTSMVRKVSS